MKPPREQKPKEQFLCPLSIIREYVNEYELLNTTATISEDCNCELRYASSICEETFDRIEDGTVITSEPRHSMASVLFAQRHTENIMDPQLSVVDPGIIKIHQPLVLMSEIQLKGIQDRLGKLDLNQKTDGAEMTTQNGRTFSKFSHEAMELGDDVTGEVGINKHANGYIRYQIYNETNQTKQTNRRNFVEA